MKRNNDYILKRLSGVPFLLPFGQAQADFKHGLRLNETGAFLWELLAEERSKTELLACCASRYEASGEEISLLSADIDRFCDTMLLAEALCREEPVAISGGKRFFFAIAGLCVELYGPKEAIPGKLFPFRTVPSKGTHQSVALCPGPPPFRQNGRLLIRDKALTVIEGERDYILLYPLCKRILETHLSRDGRSARLYYLPPLGEDGQEEIFQALRLLFLFLAERFGILAVHSASLCYRERAWLFSGPSGAGKSTHTQLWQRSLNTPLLNGDLNLLDNSPQGPRIHGLPWCGTSEIFDRKSHPLGGIILLKQSPANRVEMLPPEKALLCVLQRLVSPFWTAEMLEQSLCVLERLLPQILVCRLFCSRATEAVDVIREHIDRFLD